MDDTPTDPRLVGAIQMKSDWKQMIKKRGRLYNIPLD